MIKDKWLAVSVLTTHSMISSLGQFTTLRLIICIFSSYGITVGYNSRGQMLEKSHKDAGHDDPFSRPQGEGTQPPPCPSP